MNPFIKDKPYWVSPIPERIESLKTLVLADWSSWQWDREKINQIKKVLSELMNQGFAICMFHDGQIINLDKTNLSSIDLLKQEDSNEILLQLDNIIKLAGIEKNLPSNQIQILDDYWLNYFICEDKVPGPRVIYTSQLESCIKLHIKIYTFSLNRLAPKIETIVFDELSSEVDFNNKDYSNFCNDKSVIVDYKHVLLNGTDYPKAEIFKEIFLNNRENLKKLKSIRLDNFSNVCEFIAKLNLQENELEKLTTIEINSGPLLITLNSIFEAASNIEIIKINKFDELNGDISRIKNKLSAVEEIHLEKCSLSVENLQTILQSTKKIKKIIFSYCRDLETVKLKLDENSLPELEVININFLHLSMHNTNVLLNATTKLRELKLNYANSFGKLATLNLEPLLLKKSLLFLKSLHLEQTGFSFESLQCFIENSPNIEKLVIMEEPSISNGTFRLQPNSMKYLKILKISDCKSSQNLSALLNATIQLNDLTLYSCEYSINQSLDSILNLPNIESINLNRSYISEFSLDKILKANSQLKTLYLRNCEHLRNFFDLEENSLPHLETLDLWGTELSAKSLKMLLKAAPNLDEQSKNAIQQSILELEKRHYNSSIPQPAEPTNPVHNPSAMKEFEPKKTPYTFKNIDNTNNQGMIIDKFCQYLTITKQHQAIIPKLQDGICNALSYYFLEKSNEWRSFLKLAKEWDGSEENLNPPLTDYFKNLYTYIDNYQLQQPKTQYIDNASLISLIQSNQSMTLSNPWHTIAVKQVEQSNDWYLYDPNNASGHQRIKQDMLANTIKQTIGSLILINNDLQKNPGQLTISNPDDFIEQGGLLALCKCENDKDILSSLPKNHTYSKDALEGLLLRDTSGRPAWVLGQANKNREIQHFTNTLLNQYKSIEQNSNQALAKSLKAISLEQQANCITNNPVIKELIPLIRESANQARYQKRLQTWDKTADSVDNPLTYYQACLNGEQTKRLIELESTNQVDSLRIGLEQHAKNINRPVFYIDKADDLICQAPWLERTADNQGILHKGPGGPLYEFLQANHDKNPLLIVNYESFNAEDIVRFNGLLDKTPLADGIALPANTQVIGLLNRNKPDCYQGSDFYSRFNRTEHCPLTTEQLPAPCKSIELSLESTEDKTIINLYHSPDWEDRLLGHWVLDGDSLTWSEGALIDAIKKGKPIEIQHGFWEDKAFVRFWQQAMTLGFRHNDRIIKIPDTLKITHPEIEAYQWNNLPNVYDHVPDDATVKVLNPTCLTDFFNPYQFENNQLIKKTGWIEQAANQTLKVNITRSLNQDTWAMLLDECQLKNVTLEVYCAPGVELPEAFNHAITQPTSTPLTINNLTNDCLITSTDADTSVVMLLKAKPQSKVIDISECTCSDLLIKLNGTLNKNGERPHFEFTQSDGALTTALANGESIILKGHCSPELMDSLAPLLEARRHNNASGSILLVSDDANAGTFSPNRYTHQVTIEEKLACLNGDPLILDKLHPYLETEPLCKLKARYTYFQANPTAINSDDAWLGMKGLPGIQFANYPLNKLTSEDDCIEFTNNRINQVNAVLKSSPYVFLTGLSGVGKTTFVTHELVENTDALYQTEANIQAWAQDKSNKRKLLFIDEANLSPRQWSEFEGLFNTPPSILINGTLHELTPQHKVIFAGNPVSYGDERKQAALFERHGQAVLFTPLPIAVIYEKILKPVVPESERNTFNFNRILEVYQFVCNCSTTDILISPRELQMMALLSLTRQNSIPQFLNSHESVRAEEGREPCLEAFAHELGDGVNTSRARTDLKTTESSQTYYPSEDINDLINHFSYELAKNLIPANQRSAFDSQFKPEKPLKTQDIKKTNFLVTQSRQALSQQLTDLLQLNQWRHQTKDTLNNAQKGGGLGGIIIEGEPGIGKSELVIDTLVACGYQEEHNYLTPTSHQNPFYRMPVSMDSDEKKALLIKAFNEGAIVVIDEINSSPMMERLLNDLLMGKNPEAKPGDSVTPGFMIIGTQNPTTMSGRRATSSALQRRLITTTLPEYSFDEIKLILHDKGVDDNEAESMIKAYQENRAFAKKNNLSPPPNFRNLIELAEEYLNGRNNSADLSSSNFKSLTNIQKYIEDFKFKTNFGGKTILGNKQVPIGVYGIYKLLADQNLTANNKLNSIKELLAEKQYKKAGWLYYFGKREHETTVFYQGVENFVTKEMNRLYDKNDFSRTMR